MQLLTHPLFIEDQSGHNGEGRRGSTVKRRLVVKNLGDRAIEVDLWIVATDSKSEPLLRWCSFSERNPFRLDAKESREVILTFAIPQQATPDLYRYEVLVDAQAQYPNSPPVRRPQQLRVLPSAQDAEWGTDPVFSVKPITTAAQPYGLSAGQSLTVTISVKNCSKRVDRFYLTCPELSPDWFTVRYPESSLETPGLVQETDGLELNPGSSGEILLTLHPPQHTAAGHYFPTLRLTSSNDDNLVLLDVVYLQILVCDRLHLQLQPALRRVPAESGEFEVYLSNQGNTVRQVSIRAADPAHSLHPTLPPDGVVLEPGAMEPLSLGLTPRCWWNRPWWGQGRELPFELFVEDCNGDAATLLSPAAEPPVSAQGAILWQARPWWVLALLLLASVGLVGAIVLLILRQTLLKPAPPTPAIVAVSNTLDPATRQPQIYRADSGTAIRLDWSISRLSDIDRILVIHKERGTEIARRSYVLAGKIPTELRRRDAPSGWCEPAAVQQTDGIRCQGMPVSAATAGSHTFQIQVFSKHDRHTPADVFTTDSLTVAPITPPKIVQFAPTAPIYQVAKSSSGGAIAPVRLNWEINAPNQIQELQVVSIAADGSAAGPVQRYSFQNGLPTGLQNFCRIETRLICRNVPTTLTQAGRYTLQLTLISRQDSETSKHTPLIQLQAPPPQIQSFQLDGKEIGQTTRFQFEIDPDEPTAIALSWNIQAAPDARIELLPVPGSIPAQGAIDYSLSPTPGQQILTLRITDPSGGQLTRSILLETVAPPPPPAPSPPTPGTKPDTTPSPSPVPEKPPSASTLPGLREESKTPVSLLPSLGEGVARWLQALNCSELLHLS